MSSSDIREINSPHLTKQQAARLHGAAVFDPDELDAAIVDVKNTSSGPVAVYDEDRLAEQLIKTGVDDPRDWIYGQILPTLVFMGPRAPIVRTARRGF